MEKQLTYLSTAYFCMKNNTWTRLTLLRASSQKTIAAKLARFLPKEVLDLLVSRYTIWFGGILIGLSLFIEENHRRSELAMYVLPKALESTWATLRGRGLVFRTGKYGDAMVSAVSSLKPRAEPFAAYRRRNGNGHGMLRSPLPLPDRTADYSPQSTYQARFRFPAHIICILIIFFRTTHTTSRHLYAGFCINSSDQISCLSCQIATVYLVLFCLLLELSPQSTSDSPSPCT